MSFDNLDGEFNTMTAFRLHLVKCTLVKGFLYSVEVSKPDKFMAVCPGAHGYTGQEWTDICQFFVSAYKSKKTGLIKASKQCNLEHSAVAPMKRSCR